MDSRARVARSSSTDSFEDRTSATTRAKRWSSAETKARIAGAPEFGFPSPPRPLLDALVAEYETLTGDPVRTFPKRNLLAACYRVHGPATTAFIADEFARRGTAANLLGFIRTSPPRPSEAQVLRERHSAPPCPAEECLPHLIYCAGHRPPFDRTSTLRYDCRPSNPGAAVYFANRAAA